MRTPQGEWFMLDEAASTQDVAASLLESPDCPGVVFAHHQSSGRGRFQRAWESERGDSLTFSMVLHGERGHKKPWLLGMACAIAVARTVGGRVQWPNDVLMDAKKVAGVLIELLPFDAAEKTPVIGIGVNLNQTLFPQHLKDRATSVFLQTERRSEPLAVARQIVAELAGLPEPDEWSAIEPHWRALDETEGKRFRLPNGERATALGVSEDGALLCTAAGVERRIMAAEALIQS